MGVKGISFVSDGESTLHPSFVEAVKRGHSLGLSMAVGTNASMLNENKLDEIRAFYVSKHENMGILKRRTDFRCLINHYFEMTKEETRIFLDFYKKHNTLFEMDKKEMPSYCETCYYKR